MKFKVLSISGASNAFPPNSEVCLYDSPLVRWDPSGSRHTRPSEINDPNDNDVLSNEKAGKGKEEEEEEEGCSIQEWDTSRDELVLLRIYIPTEISKQEKALTHVLETGKYPG